MSSLCTIAKIPKSKAAFVGKSGHCYIIQPDTNQHYARYESTDAYNNRWPRPEYVTASDALVDYAKEVIIGEGLKIETV